MNGGPANAEGPWLKPYEVLNSKYTVHTMLSAGGFGQVYWATENKTGKYLAVKIEKQGSKISLLTEEAIIASKINRSACKKNDHGIRHPIVRLYDYFETPEYKILTMSMCGPNIRELKKATEYDRFSPTTTFWIMKKMVDALKVLHEFGWIHRDVKPANFCIGLGKEGAHRLYVVDFGLARKYITSTGKLREKRSFSSFRGTLRYASINAHNKKDLARVDDMWSVYYIGVENIIGKLPWRIANDRDKVGNMKQEINLLELDYGSYGDEELTKSGYHRRYNNKLDWEINKHVNKILSEKNISIDQDIFKKMAKWEKDNYGYFCMEMGAFTNEYFSQNWIIVFQYIFSSKNIINNGKENKNFL
ncbi:Casein kinase I [Strongyloides ratti]|uniref:Casein kinase I n=1 Tax=Strongyloides ratti TaxID=34506 RepID=A0A090L688_STRRB|nr:Casein kinase I [Strongyloides ratti]CEF65232.1 Casein kinase I [Strongyloides ratti]